MPSKANLIAKEKYDAVINDAGRGDWVCRTNRISAVRHPSIDCHPTNRIEHPERRRSSAASMSSIPERSWLREWMNRPAS